MQGSCSAFNLRSAPALNPVRVASCGIVWCGMQGCTLQALRMHSTVLCADTRSSTCKVQVVTVLNLTFTLLYQALLVFIVCSTALTLPD